MSIALYSFISAASAQCQRGATCGICLESSNLPMFFGHNFSIDHPQMGMGHHHKPYQK